MPNPRLASRYAKSLLDFAIEQNNVTAVLSDMKTIQNSLVQSRDLALFLQSPLIKADKKISILNTIFDGKVGPTSVAFINLLVKKGREANLFEITNAFEEQYQALNNIQKVQITAAVALNEDTLNAILTKVKKELNNENIVTETFIDPNIVGGFKLQVGDKYFDLSISRDLTDVKNQFAKNIFVADI
ncbi:MAG TPA: ATP synthase F1 subunit delta [Edaphocola sp.]|nr:ATP synthase F1 subunit delta [Edaphocola sp.]